MTWTSKIDNHLIERYNVRNRPKATRESIKRLKEHRENYRCHICLKPSSGPQTTYFKKGGRIRVKVNWRIPTSLERCVLCRKYVCKAHFHKGACQSCGEDL